jgi:hypothetical protein
MPRDVTNSIVRKGTPADYAATIELGRKMASEGWYADMPYDSNVAFANGKPYVERQDRCYFVAEKDGKVVGFFMGHLVPYFFMNDYFSEEYLWFVLPEHRTGTLGLYLFLLFEQWSEAMKAREIVCNPTIDAEIGERIGRWLIRKGYTCISGIYRRKLR